MAQDISIPVRFNCEIEPLVWTIAVARPIRWDLNYDGWTIQLNVISPAHVAGRRPFVEVEEFPGEFTKMLPSRGDKLDRSIRQMEIKILIGSESNASSSITSRRDDPWKIRDEFLSIDQNIPTLHSFLSRYGAWRRGDVDIASRTANNPTYITGKSIWQFQSELKEEMRRGAGAWFKRGLSLSGLESVEGFPPYRHTDYTIREAIETSITADFLRGLRFGLCQRSDCFRKVFPLDRKGKIYCSQYCGHLVSLRNKRAIQKTKLSKKSRGQNVDL